MKSKARNLVEKWVNLAYKNKKATYLGVYQVFIVPSSSNESTHHLVAWRQMKNGKDQFVCSCKGWYFNELDVCRHVVYIEKQITATRGKLAEAQAAR